MLSALLALAPTLANAAGPLISEIEALIAKAAAAKQEEHAAIIAEFEAATAALIAARADAATEHAALTAETQRIVNEAAKAVP